MDLLWSELSEVFVASSLQMFDTVLAVTVARTGKFSVHS